MKIRLILLLFIVCINCISVQATNCSDRFFIEQYVALGICKNYARGMEEIVPYYKGATKALNDYIALRIERGELENKRFDIFMFDPILTRPHLSLTQSKKAYYIQAGRTLSLNELMCLVDEFTQPDFTAIDMGLLEYKNEADYDKKTRQLERLEKRLFNKQLPQADIELIKNKQYTIHQQNKLEVVYKNDTVKCFIDNKEIQTKLKGLPWAIQDRYIFQECGIFKVYQDSTLIKTFRYQGKDEWECEYMDTKVYNKWINFYLNSYKEYSYSYDKNRFYDIRDKKK